MRARESNETLPWLLAGAGVLAVAARSMPSPRSANADVVSEPFVPRVLFSKELPPEAIVEGIVTAGNQTFYLYRHPTRLERLERRLSERFFGQEIRGGVDGAPEGHLWNWQAQARSRNLILGMVGLSLVVGLLIAAGIDMYRRHRRVHRERGVAFGPRRPVVSGPVARPLPPKSAGALAEPAAVERASVPTAEHTGLAGSIGEIHLDSVLQVLAGIGKTGVVIVRGPRGDIEGRILLKAGRFSDAVTASGRRGLEALADLLSLQQGFFLLRELNPLERWTLQGRNATDVVGALLEAHRMLDERHGGG